MSEWRYNDHLPGVIKIGTGDLPVQSCVVLDMAHASFSVPVWRKSKPTEPCKTEFSLTGPSHARQSRPCYLSVYVIAHNYIMPKEFVTVMFTVFHLGWENRMERLEF